MLASIRRTTVLLILIVGIVFTIESVTSARLFNRQIGLVRDNGYSAIKKIENVVLSTALQVNKEISKRQNKRGFSDIAVNDPHLQRTINQFVKKFTAFGDSLEVLEISDAKKKVDDDTQTHYRLLLI